MTSDPKILALALLGGIVPSLFWLWFWLKEDKEKPEPKGLLSIVFIVGMASVVVILPIEKFIQAHIASNEWQIVLWASIEELIKYLAVVIVLWKSSYLDEPVDWPIYLITAALGFAALENAMYLITPLSLEQATVSLLTGQLRFLGSTLLHTVSSATIGIALGLSFNMGKVFKKSYLLLGLGLAISLHSAFNFFIMKNDGNDFFKVVGFLWVTTIIIMLVFEKLRRMSEDNNKIINLTN